VGKILDLAKLETPAPRRPFCALIFIREKIPGGIDLVSCWLHYPLCHWSPQSVHGSGARSSTTGHEVIFFNTLDTSHALAPAGLHLVSFAEVESPVGELQAATQKIGELSGPSAFANYVERMVLFFRASFRDLPELIPARADRSSRH
jgi:hypothetical protein